jgi:hypothetical protein
MIFGIFLWVHLPSLCPLWWGVSSRFFSFFKIRFVYFLIKFSYYLYILNRSSLSVVCTYWKYFLNFFGLFIHSFNSIFCIGQISNFVKEYYHLKILCFCSFLYHASCLIEQRFSYLQIYSACKVERKIIKINFPKTNNTFKVMQTIIIYIVKRVALKMTVTLSNVLWGEAYSLLSFIWK